MNNHKNKGLDRKKWGKPEIKSLKFSQTLGGGTPGEFEGFPYDGSQW